MGLPTLLMPSHVFALFGRRKVKLWFATREWLAGCFHGFEIKWLIKNPRARVVGRLKKTSDVNVRLSLDVPTCLVEIEFSFFIFTSVHGILCNHLIIKPWVLPGLWCRGGHKTYIGPNIVGSRFVFYFTLSPFLV